MRTIVVKRQEDGKWGAFYLGKRIVASGCKPCVINSLLVITKNSTNYGYIAIQNEDGTPDRTILTGVHSGRETEQNLPGS